MVGELQPLAQNFQIVKPDGTPTNYFIRWAQQQLSGDVPASRQVIAGTGLSGGGALTSDVTLNLEDTAVTPGSYTNTNLTVDQQGRITSASSGSGAGSALEATLTKPVVADFTSENHGANTVMTDGVGAMLMSKSSSDATNQVISQSLVTVPAAPFSLYTRLDYSSMATGGTMGGLVCRNSTNSRLVLFGLDNSAASGCSFIILRFTNSNTFSASPINKNASRRYTWVRVDVTSTTISYYESPNGWDWDPSPIFTETIATFLTASGGGSLDQIGIWINSFSVNRSILYLYSFSFTAPA